MERILPEKYVTAISNILITGGDGFIAHNFGVFIREKGLNPYFLNYDNMKEKNNYYLVKDHNVRFELDSLEELRLLPISGVLHLATNYKISYNVLDFNRLVEASLILTNELAEMCVQKSLPLIVSGSYFQDKSSEELIINSPYITIKNAGEEILSYKNMDSDLNFAVTRQYESYGKFDSRNKLLNRLIANIISGEETELPETNIHLDFLNVLDICEAYLKIFEEMFSETFRGLNKYEISSKKPIYLDELVGLLEKKLNKRLYISSNKQDRRGTQKTELDYPGKWPPNWRPKYDFRNDLDALIEHIVDSSK